MKRTRECEEKEEIKRKGDVNDRRNERERERERWRWEERSRQSFHPSCGDD